MKLQNKVALITGGARGIGFAIARRYGTEGAKVVIADIDGRSGRDARDTLGESACRFVKTDVGDPESATQAIAETCGAFGKLDLLVNNAGIVHAADFLEI